MQILCLQLCQIRYILLCCTLIDKLRNREVTWRKNERTNERTQKRDETQSSSSMSHFSSLSPQSSAYNPGKHTQRGTGGGDEQRARKDLYTCTIQTCEKLFFLVSYIQIQQMRNVSAREHRYTYIFGSGVGEVTNSAHSEFEYLTRDKKERREKTDSLYRRTYESKQTTKTVT